VSERERTREREREHPYYQGLKAVEIGSVLKSSLFLCSAPAQLSSASSSNSIENGEANICLFNLLSTKFHSLPSHTLQIIPFSTLIR